MLSKKVNPEYDSNSEVSRFKIRACKVLGFGGGAHGYKRTGEEFFEDGIVLDLDSSGGHTYLHMG